MDDGGRGKKDGRRHTNCDSGNQRIVVEVRQQRTCPCKAGRQDKSNSAVDPEEVTRLKAIYFGPLNNSLFAAINTNTHQEEAKGGDHSHYTEIARREQPRQDNRANYLGRESQRRSGYRRCRASNGKTSQFAASSDWMESTAVVEWDHSWLGTVEQV